MRVVLDTNILVRANPTVAPHGLARDLLGQADILCSRDNAFRSEKVEQVCARHGIRILDDVSLLQELRRTKLE